jgi:hypothetical protein
LKARIKHAIQCKATAYGKWLRMKPYFIYFALSLIAYCASLHTHGFAPHTLIRSHNGWQTIQQLCRSLPNNAPYLTSYEQQSNAKVARKVQSASIIETNCYFIIGLDDSPDIICTPSQEFYLPAAKAWVPACQLKIDDQLFSECSKFKSITSIEFITQPLQVYAIEIENTHNFLVGRHCILTHNMALPALSSGMAMYCSAGATAGGAAGGLLGPVTAIGGALAGCFIGYVINALVGNNKVPHYKLEFNIDAIEEQFKQNIDQASKNDNAQAPGKPTEKDGFIAPKRWDGKKVRHPKNGKVGWPDKDGKVWVPTGPGPLAHGGPHWDVQHPDGKTYDNVYPGGKIRSGS